MAHCGIILDAPTLARLTLGVALQSVAALAPAMMARTGKGWAEVGALIGAFRPPGVAASPARGGMGARRAEGRVAIGGLSAMAAAGAAMAFLNAFETPFAPRTAPGAGAVALDVMLADEAQKKDPPIALSLLGSSRPKGMAPAPPVPPPTAASVGDGETPLCVAQRRPGGGRGGGRRLRLGLHLIRRGRRSDRPARPDHVTARAWRHGDDGLDRPGPDRNGHVARSPRLRDLRRVRGRNRPRHAQQRRARIEPGHGLFDAIHDA
ncbi:MAG: hypothetical protein AAFU61_00465 [Pseudomonadota bacterium]